LALPQAHQNRAGVGDPHDWAGRKALMLAMAMQESNHMDVHQRDSLKDDDSLAANCSIFNLSVVSEACTGLGWSLFATDLFSRAAGGWVMALLNCAMLEQACPLAGFSFHEHRTPLACIRFDLRTPFTSHLTVIVQYR
jgi:hypothetical protein